MRFLVAFSVLAQQIEKQTGIGEEELELLKSFFTLEIASKKAVLTRLGSVEKRIYFVSDGVLRAWFECDGEDKTAAFVYRGYWGSSFGSFLSEKESPYEIETLSEATLLVMSKEKLAEVLQVCPSFAIYYRKLLESLIVGMQFRERELMASDARERFERFMNQSAFLLKVVPQKQLASYLNMTAETFSRLRRAWMETS